MNGSGVAEIRLHMAVTDVNDEWMMHLRARARWQGVEEEGDRARLA